MNDSGSGITMIALIVGALLVLVVGLYATGTFTKRETTDVLVQTPQPPTVITTPAAPPTVVTTPAPQGPTIINPPAQPATPPSETPPPSDTTEPPAEPAPSTP